MTEDSNDSSLDRLIGAKIKDKREAAGIKQKELAERLGVSYNKIYTMERGINRLFISDLQEVAKALGIPLWSLLYPAIELPDLRSYLQAVYSDLDAESGQAIDEIFTINKWAERRWRIKTNMFYRPMLYSGPSTLPMEFDQEWFNPILREGNRFLYVAIEADGLRGRFFDVEIAPSDSPLEYDKPRPRDSRWWETEEQLDLFLRENGYCWQYYPFKTHRSEYCTSDH